MAASTTSEREHVRRRPDPRLLVGGALVLVSSLGCWALVASLDDTVEVVAAQAALTPGTRLTADDVEVQRVRLGDAAERYLAPADLPDDGLVITRSVLAGELVPRSAIEDAGRGAGASVVVPTAGTLPSAVRPGARVDVWAAEPGEGSAFLPPSILVAGAEVAVVGEPESKIGSAERTVELVVPRASLGAVLAALAAGDAIDLVPAAAEG